MLDCRAVSLGRWFIASKVLKLKVTMRTFFLHVSKLDLGSVADFLKTGVRKPTSAKHGSCLPAGRAM